MKLEMRHDVKSLERRMDDLFRDIWAGFPGRFPRTLGRLRQSFTPSSDVFRRGDDLIARVEIPGIDPERDLTVQVIGDELVIQGVRRESSEVAEDDYVRREAWYGSYERRLPLPEGTGEDAVRAAYDKGVLEVTIEGAARQIEESAESPARTIPVHTRS